MTFWSCFWHLSRVFERASSSLNGCLAQGHEGSRATVGMISFSTLSSSGYLVPMIVLQVRSETLALLGRINDHFCFPALPAAQLKVSAWSGNLSGASASHNTAIAAQQHEVMPATQLTTYGFFTQILEDIEELLISGPILSLKTVQGPRCNLDHASKVGWAIYKRPLYAK